MLNSNLGRLIMDHMAIWRSFLIMLFLSLTIQSPTALTQPPSPLSSPGGTTARSLRLGITVQSKMSHQGKIYLYTMDDSKAYDRKAGDRKAYDRKAYFFENGKQVLEGDTGRRYEIKREKCKVVVRSENGLFSFKEGSEEIDGDNVVQDDITLSPDQVLVIKWPRVFILAALFIMVFIWGYMQKRSLQQRVTPADSASQAGTGDIPATVGPYSIIEKLGRGGMATVYKTRDTHGDIYALKVPHPHIFEIPEFRARFLREAEIIRTLHHANIVRLYDYGSGQDGETPYICLEFVTGISLRKFLEENPVLPTRRVAKMITEIAVALGYAHSKGIVHRDIKPDNIMLTTKGVIKVMDLGIARAVDKQTLTATGTTLGTPHYIAPEQVEMKKVDGRADLYSLGVIFYQMLAAKLPFDAEEPINVILMHVSEEPEPPTRHNALIPKELEAIVMKLLRKDPAERFQTAAELIAALKKYL
jgi:tRNA A-37 threonylcarbamoyl transferase component Bud32